VWPGCKDALDHDRTVGRPEHDFLRTTTTGCPLKKIDVSAQTGDGGIALIHQQVNKMGFVWHERKTDAGIDGEIELRNPVTGEVANRFILIQSKASNRRFSGENDRSFHFICEPADVTYWMGAEEPVLLVCSHPEAGQAWWMHVQGWFSDPAHRASGRIDFDKSTQRFDADAAHKACERSLSAARPHDRRLRVRRIRAVPRRRQTVRRCTDLGRGPHAPSSSAPGPCSAATTAASLTMVAARAMPASGVTSAPSPPLFPLSTSSARTSTSLPPATCRRTRSRGYHSTS
jgi:hypothetical protein